MGGGAAYGQRLTGRSGLAAHPHHSQWLEVQALVADGLRHSRAMVGGGGGGGPGGSQPLLGGREGREGSAGKHKHRHRSAGRRRT